MNPVRESLQKQREFIAAASHELRSPLAVLRVNLSALRQSSPVSLPDLQDETLSDMEEEIIRMSALVDDMLFLASMDASGSVRWQASLRPLELDAFLIDLYEDFFPLAAEHQMTLELLLPEEPLPSCIADQIGRASCRERVWYLV